MIFQKQSASASRSPAKHGINVALNIGGVAIPVLAGIVAIPLLVQHLGQEGFATLVLGWTVVGYFSLLDVGVGRALTLHIARADEADDIRAAAALARTGRRLMLGLGGLWTLLLLPLYPVISAHWPILTSQTSAPALAWTLLVLCIPFTLWFNSSTGVLEAHSRFVDVNMVRIPLGIATYVGPLITSMFTRDISWMFCSLLLARVIAAGVLGWQARHTFAIAPRETSKDDVRRLLKFGGWMTVSQVVGPLFVHFDRFAIAAVISVVAVTQYTVPFDLLTRLTLFPIAVMSVLFPIFVQAHGNQGKLSAAKAFVTAQKTLRLLLVAWLPFIILTAFLGPGLLKLWVGDDLGSAGSPILQWLIVGVAVNGLAHLPLALLQSKGRTDIIAWLHLIELAPYLIAVWWALENHGIEGAAIVWTARVTIDAILMHMCARRAAPYWESLLRVTLVASLVIAGALAVLAWMRN